MHIRLLKIFLLCLLFLISYSYKGISQSTVIDTTFNSEDTTGTKNTILPFIFFLPETGLAFGVTGISTFRLSGESTASRPSQVIYSAAYTLKNQLLLYVPYEIYKNENRIRYKGEIGFYKYFYNFYGIGGESLVGNLENYDVLFPRVDFNYSRSDIKDVFIGGGFKYDNFDITQIDSAGILSNEQPIGYEGGTKMNILFNAFYDNRDNVFAIPSTSLLPHHRFVHSWRFLSHPLCLIIDSCIRGDSFNIPFASS